MLHTITPDLHWVPGHMTMTGGVPFPLRMTVVRLTDGSLMLISPIKTDDETLAAIDALGPVRHLVAPNTFHHLFIGKMKERYPEATMWAAPGLAEKRDDLSFDGVLGDEAPAPWADLLDQHLIKGMPQFNEVVFFHRDTKTLISTDLLFNITNPDGGIIPSLLFRAAGTYKRLAVSRLFLSQVKDKPAAASSALHIVKWAPERLIMAHGDIVEGAQAKLLPDVMRKMLGTRYQEAVTG